MKTAINSRTNNKLKQNKRYKPIVICITILLQFFLFILVTYWNKKYKIGLSNNDIERTVGTFLLLSIFVIFIFPQWIPMIKKEFVKSQSIKVILVPLFLTLVVDYLIELSRYFPILLGGEMIKIGKYQVVNQLKNYSISSFIFMGLYPAIIEEFIFRFVPLGGIKVLLENLLKGIEKHKYNVGNKKFLKLFDISFNKLYENLYVKKRSVLLVIVIILMSTLFSLLHGPDITNFYLYFISGLLYSYYYLKYGYLACIVGHSMSNYLCFTYSLAKLTGKIIFGIS